MVREPVTVESRIEQVTVYARGARVRRVARLRAPLPNVVRFSGLPLSVIDDTVRSEVEGAAFGAAIRVGVDTPAGEARPEESDDHRAARQRVVLAESDVERLGAALDRLAGASLIEEDPSDDPPAAWNAIVAARRELVGARARREAMLREQRANAFRELEEAQRALDVIIEREQNASTARAARLHEVRKYAELDLVAQVGANEVTVRIEYQVPAARWAPSYVARLDGDQARFELRAVVAQHSGEDWSDVALRLSTAEPERLTQLPELHPQKIGRRQQDPAKRGFRAPPSGADALYADYDRSFPRVVRTLDTSVVFDDSTYEGRAPSPPEEAMAALAEQVWDEESSRSKERYRGAPPPAPAMPVMAPPMAPLAKKSSGLGGADRSGPGAGPLGSMTRGAGALAAPFAMAAQAISRNAPGGGAAGGLPQLQAPAAPTPRLDYANLRMAAPSSPERGTLVPAPREYGSEVARHVEQSISVIAQLHLPPGHDDEWSHAYDYAFASDGDVEIASDAAWHSIALTASAGAAKVRHVAVPREQADVFRVAAITNPFDGPLLPGPIDIYDRGQFLVTSEVDYTPPGGTVDIGLGVDPAVKIARNVEFHEEAVGMLRGALRLVHAISIDIENLAPRPIDLEVRERVPVTREGDDDVEVSVGKVDPPWERFAPDSDAPGEQRLRGGFRWQITVAPATKKLLRAAYEVKIANKHELVGGNRREP